MHNEFEITVRLHGPVTEHLKRQNPRSRLEIPLRGFGGDFVIETRDKGATPFVAGGVGITPLLGQLDQIDLEKLRLFWILRLEDIDFVIDIFRRYPSLAKHAKLFFTGASDTSQNGQVNSVRTFGASVELRRPAKEDFGEAETIAEKWYLCAGNPLRRKLLEWLEGRKVVFENFDY
jgi:predicted ferric reductase